MRKIIALLIVATLASCDGGWQGRLDEKDKQISILKDSIRRYRSYEITLYKENKDIQEEYLRFVQIHMYCQLIETEDNECNIERFTIKDTDGRLHKLKYNRK